MRLPMGPDPTFLTSVRLGTYATSWDGSVGLGLVAARIVSIAWDLVRKAASR